MLITCIYIFSLTLASMIGVSILKWNRFPEKRPCWLFDHDKRYLAMKEIKLEQDWHGCSNHQYRVTVTECSTIPNTYRLEWRAHKKGELIYYARWSCRRCSEMGEECFGSKQDWKIEHEQVVPDTKKWANWSK